MSVHTLSAPFLLWSHVVFFFFFSPCEHLSFLFQMCEFWRFLLCVFDAAMSACAACAACAGVNVNVLVNAFSVCSCFIWS